MKPLQTSDCCKFDDVPEEVKDAVFNAFSEKAESEKGCKAKLHLGIDVSWDAKSRTKVLQASYYIGAGRLKFKDDQLEFYVTPRKISEKETDYISMFATALDVSSSEDAEYFSSCYYIDTESEPLTRPEKCDDPITPLLLLHYVALLGQLTKSGLRKGYVLREENLQSKVRGRIQFREHLRKNVFNKRDDRVYCRYQEFTTDIPENRLLKKALSLAKSSLQGIKSFNGNSAANATFRNISEIETHFACVSDEVNISQVKGMTESKLFRHYAEAIRVAKLILRYFDYDVSADASPSREHKIRPYCIDMARLYEMYVYHKLNEAYPNEIRFQVKGRHRTQVDYIRKGAKEKIILDAKYKPRYEKGNAGIIADVREISGYARDTKILDALGWPANVDGKDGKLLPDCVIIYPVVQVEESEEGMVDTIPQEACKSVAGDFDGEKTIVCQSDPIRAFEGFYKIAVPLPIKQ